jgi:hypothetical protein
MPRRAITVTITINMVTAITATIIVMADMVATGTGTDMGMGMGMGMVTAVITDTKLLACRKATHMRGLSIYCPGYRSENVL